MGRRGHECEYCGKWTPFMRGQFPSAIEHDIQVGHPLDVQEWDSEIYEALETSDCLWDEKRDFVYWWSRTRSVVKRTRPALLGIRVEVRYDGPKNIARRKRLSWYSSKEHAEMKAKSLIDPGIVPREVAR